MFISSRAGYAVVLGTASDVKVHLLVEELGGHFRLQVGVDLIQVFSPALRLPLPCLVFMWVTVVVPVRFGFPHDSRIPNKTSWIQNSDQIKYKARRCFGSSLFVFKTHNTCFSCGKHRSLHNQRDTYTVRFYAVRVIEIRYPKTIIEIINPISWESTWTWARFAYL